MPQYHILSRLVKKERNKFRSEGIIKAISIRAAWAGYKKFLKDKNKKPDLKREYNFYSINHSRMWIADENDKFKIDSFYGNHESRETRDARKTPAP